MSLETGTLAAPTDLGSPAGVPPTPAGAAGARATVDDIVLDALPGADDEKLTTALALARVSSPRRAIRLSGRQHTFTRSHTTFSGLRILGPDASAPLPAGAPKGRCTVVLNCGSEDESWLVGTSTTYNVMVAEISFTSANAQTQFFHHPAKAGTCYAATFDTLSFDGFKHVLGTPRDAFSMTQVTTKGSWSCTGAHDTQFTLRGSDNVLWVAGDMHYGSAGTSGRPFLMRFSHLAKTSVRHLFLTACSGARAILVEGPALRHGGLDISDCVVEGEHLDDPATGALIVVSGGGVSFTNTLLNFRTPLPADFTDQADTALIMVKGGTAQLTNTWTRRTSGSGDTVPVIAVSGGAAYVSHFMASGDAQGRPRGSRTGGTLVADDTLLVA